MGFAFSNYNPEVVEDLLKVNWTKKHFSKAIWDNSQSLGTALKEEFMVNYLTGGSTDDMARRLAERMNVNYFNARRLVRTESTFVEAEMEARGYEACHIDEYEYVSVLDNRTSNLCRQHDGKIYKVKDRQPGVNYPPLHVFCRATTIAHIPEDYEKELTDEEVREIERMSFEDWKEEFALEDAFETDAKRFQRKQSFPRMNGQEAVPELYTQAVKEFRAATRKSFANGTDIGKKILIAYGDVSKEAFATLVETEKVRYEKGKIYLNIFSALQDDRGVATSYFHELGHQIDDKLGRKFAKDKKIKELLKSDFAKIDIIEILPLINTSAEASAVSDIISGLSKNAVVGRYQHSQEYWKNDSTLESEFFAHVFESQFNSTRKDMLERYFPLAYNYIIDLLRGL